MLLHFYRSSSSTSVLAVSSTVEWAAHNQITATTGIRVRYLILHFTQVSTHRGDRYVELNEAGNETEVSLISYRLGVVNDACGANDNSIAQLYTAGVECTVHRPWSGPYNN